MARGPLADLYPSRGLSIVRGEGAYLFAKDGTRYLDLMTNYGANLLGHGNPAILEAIASQSRALIGLHGSFTSEVRLRASTAVLRRLPMFAEGAALYWGNSGAEAIEAAIKFAAATRQRPTFIAATGGFHGKTIGALALTEAGKYRALFDRMLLPVRHVLYGSLDALAEAIDDSVAAVVLEPIQGEGGVVVPPAGYLRTVLELCRARGVLVILDEIQTGCGRTGTFTVAEREGIAPDLLCLGKGLAGGLPVGVAAMSAAVADRLTNGLHTSTFGGNPLVAAAVLATLATLEADLLARVAVLGAWFADRLAAMSGDEVRGRGLMIGAAVGPSRDRVLKALQERLVLAIPAGTDVVRFLPPLSVTAEQLATAVEAWGLARSRNER
ncbi:MAG: aspartate aminotransferase family protein [Gemmatimonadetes bacterium]|nr:aspartate aminotransferase family protein [Gemmatimonadota bacterium]